MRPRSRSPAEPMRDGDPVHPIKGVDSFTTSSYVVGVEPLLRRAHAEPGPDPGSPTCRRTVCPRESRRTAVRAGHATTSWWLQSDIGCQLGAALPSVFEGEATPGSKPAEAPCATG